MNQALIIVSVILISVYPIKNIRIDTIESGIKTEQDTSQQPLITPMHFKGLSQLDESKFPLEKVDTLLDLNKFDLKNLPEITEIRYFNYGEGPGKYFCNRTFSVNFKTYILYVWEGGDCSPEFLLMNIKGDSVLAWKIINIYCAWEHGVNRTGSVFINDSTFTLFHNGWNNEHVKDSVQHTFSSQKYRIASNGGFILLDQRNEKWNEWKQE